MKGIDVAGNEEKYYAHYCWTVETFTKTTGCSFVYSLNHAEYVSTEDSHASVTNLPDGTNSFVVKAVDMYGHETTEDYKNTFTWTVGTSLRRKSCIGIAVGGEAFGRQGRHWQFERHLRRAGIGVFLFPRKSWGHRGEMPSCVCYFGLVIPLRSVLLARRVRINIRAYLH